MEKYVWGTIGAGLVLLAILKLTSRIARRRAKKDAQIADELIARNSAWSESNSRRSWIDHKPELREAADERRAEAERDKRAVLCVYTRPLEQNKTYPYRLARR